MSWPLKYDPASQSISFGGRNKTLYPNSLTPFDQVALAAADVSRTYCDRDRERRPRPGNGHSEVGGDKVVDASAEGTNPEGRCTTDTSLNYTTFISYTKLTQVEDSRQKQKRFVESLARGKWNRYRRQYTSSTSNEAHNPTNSLSTHGHASSVPIPPTNMPYLTLSEACLATLNHQAARELGREDPLIEVGEWSSDSLLVDYATIIPTTEESLVIFDVDMVMSEARLGTLAGRNQTHDPNFIHTTQTFFQRLLHPHENIIKPALQLATKMFCLPHNNKIQHSEKQAQASDVDLEKNVPLSKREVKEWRARRGGYKPLFSGEWMQNVAKAVENVRKGEEGRHEKDVGGWR